MTGLQTSSAITTNAPRDEVWKALTTPELIKQWFFGVETESNWKVGGALIHRGEWQGKPYEDKGEILQFDPPNLLAHTHWSALSGQSDRPENYQRVTWTLSETKGASELTVREESLPSEKAKAISEQAWATVLNNLKQLVEGTETTSKVA